MHGQNGHSAVMKSFGKLEMMLQLLLVGGTSGKRHAVKRSLVDLQMLEQVANGFLDTKIHTSNNGMTTGMHISTPFVMSFLQAKSTASDKIVPFPQPARQAHIDALKK